MKILIIGSKGFIGSYCVDYFIQHHSVWQCDVNVDYTTPNYFQVDATNANFEAIFKTQKFDVCINCSGAASVPESILNPQRDFELNVNNVYKQLSAIKNHLPNCKYINLSSAAVYGNPEVLPIKENQSLNPISPYGYHKKMAEEICQQFYALFNIKTCSLRVFSAYGNGLKKQLLWDLSKKSKASKHVELFGTGKETRDFIHVIDVVNAINCVINNCNFEADVINVANAKEIAISEIVTLFFNFYNEVVYFRFIGENRKGDPINWVADISKLSALGYKQTVPIEQGIKQYTTWLKENE